MKAFGGGGGGVSASVTCGACFEPYEERGDHVPLIVPCGHTYCSSCLSSLPAPKKCPTCRTPLGNAPVSSLPHNFTLLELLAAMPPPAPPAHEKRSLSSMTDEELAQYMEERRLQKTKIQEQAAALTAQKQEIEAQRHVVLQAAVELDARIETSEQACAKLLNDYNVVKAGLDKLKTQALAKQQQEQGLAQQVASIEVQIDDLLKNKQPAAQSTATSTASVAEAVRAAREGVRISGATGNSGDRVNGLYEVTDEVSGGMPVYKKKGGDRQLHYLRDEERWVTCRIEYKDKSSDFSAAYVDCAIGVLPDNAPRGAWRVGHGNINGAYSVQASVVVAPMSAAEVAAQMAEEAAAVEAACAAARAAATYAVRISGATGSCAVDVNGVYEVTHEVSGGMPVYKKQGADMWLEYNVSIFEWTLRPTDVMGQASFDRHAFVACAIGVLPDEAPRGAWQVANGAAWTSQATVVVSKN